MVLLLARLGLRAEEVVRVQLDDIDWRSGELLVRGKGQRHDILPLPHEVGQALADYVRRDRKTDSRVLFVTHRRPCVPFVDAQVLNGVLEAGFKKAGIKPTRYVGSHILRTAWRRIWSPKEHPWTRSATCCGTVVVGVL